MMSRPCVLRKIFQFSCTWVRIKNGDYRYLPERHPRLKIIYAHAAVPFFRDVWNYAQKRENIFVDLSSPVYMNENIMARVVQELGAEKCLYGTDGPYTNSTHGRMLARIHQLPLSEDDRERILRTNFLEMIRAKY